MNLKQYGKVAVLMGGTSAEREISLKSGNAVLSALLRQGVDAVAVDSREPLLPALAQHRPDRVFIALHGRGGEDGVIQGFLQTLALPHTGSGLLGSALGMDKYRCKQIWHDLGLPVPPGQLLTPDSDPARVVAELGLPLMVKPAHEGSSVGMTLAQSVEQLEAACREAMKYDDLVLAESYIAGGEYTAAILDGQVLPLIKLETPRAFYDYAAKYSDPGTRYLCPCGLPPAREQSLGELALRAFQAIGASGWGRVDFMLDHEARPWLLEVNTVPGMTDHSLVPMAARQAGMDFDSLVLRILDTACP